MKKAILYTRVSTDEQADKGFSLRDQDQKLKSYCKRNNIEAKAIYTCLLTANVNGCNLVPV